MRSYTDTTDNLYGQGLSAVLTDLYGQHLRSRLSVVVVVLVAFHIGGRRFICPYRSPTKGSP